MERFGGPPWRCGAGNAETGRVAGRVAGPDGDPETRADPSGRYGRFLRPNGQPRRFLPDDPQLASDLAVLTDRLRQCALFVLFRIASGEFFSKNDRELSVFPITSCISHNPYNSSWFHAESGIGDRCFIQSPGLAANRSANHDCTVCSA